MRLVMALAGTLLAVIVALLPADAGTRTIRSRMVAPSASPGGTVLSGGSCGHRDWLGPAAPGLRRAHGVSGRAAPRAFVPDHVGWVVMNPSLDLTAGCLT